MPTSKITGCARNLHGLLLGAGLHVRRWRLGDPRGYCVACRREVPSFRPYRGGLKSRPPLMNALDVVGSDVDRHACPRCGCHDRERHLLLYFDKLGFASTLMGASILHFAPETAVSRLIRNSSPGRYVQADLRPSRPDVESIDVCHMPYEDHTFDLVIANHVLEHVDNDGDALREIVRVLRPGGRALLQTPFSNLLAHTLEDPGVKSAEARRALYGQEDHVRLYGRDFAKRVMQAGLVPCGHSHQALLPDIDPRRYGVNPREPLMLFRLTG